VNATEVISMNFSEPVEAGAKSLPCGLKLLNDQNLVVRAKGGDTAAFVELGERHSTKVRRTVYRITRNWEDAEDALQESLLKAFRHLNGFENRSSFSSWLTKIAINSALMTLRKRRACKEVSMDVVGGWNRRIFPKTPSAVTRGVREKNCSNGRCFS
jgi:DNA-directed RNA polymerase specialized sigma24 family protein